jgi:plastocyanin
MNKSLRVAVTAVICALTFGLGACGSSSKGTTGDTQPGIANTVTIKDFAFIPKDLPVKPGTAVTWNNTDGVNHQIAIKDGATADPIGQGGQTVLNFNEIGKIEYFCNIHNSMTGTVTVLG